MRARNCAALALGLLLILGACSWAAAARDIGALAGLQSHLGPYDALALAAGGGAAAAPGRALLRQQSKKQKEAARKKKEAAAKKKEAAAAKKKKQEQARRDAFFSTQEPVVVPALPPLAAAPALPDAGTAPEQPAGPAPTETPVPAPVAQPWLPSAPLPGGFSSAAPGAIPQAQTRDAMCTAGSRTGAVVVAGKRTGSGYYNACRYTASGEDGCCANCKANAECKGWFFTRMDCTAFGGGADVGVCYMIANPVAAWVEAGASAAGGVLARA
jgi:hypothetical protein